MLTSVIFIPSVGSLLLLLVGKNPRISRLVALFFVILELILVLILFVTFDRSTTGYSFIERANWVPLFNIQYLLAVDGLSVSLVFLNAILGVVAVLISWTITEKVREYFALLLLLQTAVMGVFISMDMFLFFVFWELELIPMYFLIAKWGSGRKEYSAMKVLLFTLIGSAFMFISIIALYLSQPVADRTFDMMILAERDISGLIPYAGLISIGFLVAFAVKLPIFPFHTWLFSCKIPSSRVGRERATVKNNLRTHLGSRIRRRLLSGRASLACSARSALPRSFRFVSSLSR